MREVCLNETSLEEKLGQTDRILQYETGALTHCFLKCRATRNLSVLQRLVCMHESLLVSVLFFNAEKRAGKGFAIPDLGYGVRTRKKRKILAGNY